MSERDDLAKLAQDFVDLWQEHVAAAAADPAMLRWTEAWMAPLQALTGDGAAQRAAAPGAAPGDLDRRLDEFARRLAVCEERLAALEQRTRGGRGTDRDGPGGRRS